ncbi:UDP-N-acetylglucosamine pyrophosphorylase [Tichowtungia aerotolerans]|uniref:UDP-N-acetylglucosamine pyrophosphorylase n=1 Tax=Tichowtungia aerotolerans TaxID=2697043 RepID=A0A6P1M9X8_9BACT|nr:UDP-N-acetylglucosamine pyrophosphorylase [Tichowtungia aerotolerans]QHI69883.1 UDP-N-acetylglucosamine pyrophosphorylase [Tichowtungia aerotolerans]
MSAENRVAVDAVIHPGCRILNSSIGPGCELGAEAPVTLKNCRLGRNVKLKGGYFEGAVFLDGSNMGSGAHVRAGTILEEKANGAHTVGLKQTVLLPFVTLGSLINFCDVLMAGGTSRKDHSEVGSSYVHFNFTPNQDKATASLVGDVPRGVLLNQKPVFLGGQGGLVGPSRIEYGSIIAAGGICRKDILQEGQLYVPPAPVEKMKPFEPGRYGNIDRIVQNNLIYIGNIKALKAWYENIRVLFIRDEYDQVCLDGAIANLDLILNERFQRLEKLGEKVPAVGRNLAENSKNWKAPVETVASASLMSEIEKAERTDYVNVIQNLSQGAQFAATAWLQGIVNESMI